MKKKSLFLALFGTLTFGMVSCHEDSKHKKTEHHKDDHNHESESNHEHKDGEETHHE
ncbi:MAG: hypothetical protein ACOZCO_07260 [Bacteroidota bacterium]